MHVALSLFFKGTLKVQLIADRVAQNLEIISTTSSTNQNSAHEIYDEYQVIHDKSHENPDTPSTKLKVFRNNLKILCHRIRSWLYHCFLKQKVCYKYIFVCVRVCVCVCVLIYVSLDILKVSLLWGGYM